MKFLPAMLCGSLLAMATFWIAPVQADDQMAASMCDYIKADDKNRLRKLLSDNRLRLRNIYDGIVCNGQNMVRFAVAHNANNVGEFIIKQLPAAQIGSSGDIAWAEANHASSGLIEVLKTRAGGGD
jgi:hypothetical protein